MKNDAIPLFVGVTGHRDLRKEDMPRLRSIVGKIFADLKETYPGNPIGLLSALAEGADRLAAHVALEQGMELIVPLPMPLDDYRNDFKTVESQHEFTVLLEKAKSAFLAPDEPGFEPVEPDHEGSRNWFYARVGRYIIKHSHILLALWDGDPAEKTGGTSQVVRQKREGLPSTFLSDGALPDPLQSGAIFHVVTPRQSNPNPPGAFQARKIYANDSVTKRGGESRQ